MAVMTGNSGIVQVALTGQTEATVGEVRSFSIEETADTVESTSMGDISRTFTPSFRSGTVTIEALFDVDTAGSNQAILDVSKEVDWVVSPTGDPNDEGYTGSGIVTSKSVSVPYDDMITVSFTIQTSGGITAS